MGGKRAVGSAELWLVVMLEINEGNYVCMDVCMAVELGLRYK